MPGFVFSKGVFCFDKILWASYLAVHAHKLSCYYIPVARLGGTRAPKPHRVFFFSLLLFMLMAVKRTGSVDIPYFDSHLHCCGVSVPGEARLRGGLRRSQNAEKLQAWAEARAAVSLIGLLAV